MALAAPVLFAGVVFLNAQIATMNPAQPRAHHLAVADGKMTYVGDDSAAARRAAGARPEEIDVGGRGLLPGFIDAHAHFGLGLTIGAPQALDLPAREGTPAEVRRAFADAIRAAPGSELLFVKIRELPEGIKRAAQLDFVARPLFVVSAHGGLFNSAGLRLAGLTLVEAPDGFVRGRNLAVALERLAKALPFSLLGDAARAFLRMLAEHGITSVHLIDELPDLFESLRKRGELSARVRMTPLGFRFDTRLYQPSWIASAPEWLRVEGVKYFHDDGARIGRRDLRAIFDVNVPLGRPVLVHVLSRGALTSLLDGLEAALATLPVADRARAAHLFRLEHVDELNADDAARLARLGIVVCSNPSMLPEFRSERAFPMATLRAAGVRTCIGSDYVGAHTPPRPIDPWSAIALAVNRPGKERITVEEALEAYTAGSAAAEGATQKGVLAPGKWADLIVVSRDPLTTPPAELGEITTLLTMVGGKIVHRALELPAISSPPTIDAPPPSSIGPPRDAKKKPRPPGK